MNENLSRISETCATEKLKFEAESSEKISTQGPVTNEKITENIMNLFGSPEFKALIPKKIKEKTESANLFYKLGTDALKRQTEREIKKVCDKLNPNSQDLATFIQKIGTETMNFIDNDKYSLGLDANGLSPEGATATIKDIWGGVLSISAGKARGGNVMFKFSKDF